MEGMHLLALLPSLLLAAAPALRANASPQAAERSTHAAQQRERAAQPQPPHDDLRELAREQTGLGEGAGPLALGAPASARPFIVFGYLQSETQVAHTRWRALTHVGSLFVGFNASGSLIGASAFTGRSSALRAGGAAQAAGVKVILVVNNFDDAPGGSLELAMTSPAARANLATQIAAVVAADSYCQGVSLDLEFTWGAAVRDGITAFVAQLRAALDAVDPTLELSIYVNPLFNASQWDFDATSGITPHVDYVLYSMYDWATGSIARAISDFDNAAGASGWRAYLADGVPPEKLVPVVSAYSRRWSGVTSYNATGSSPASQGFTDALFDVTLNPSFGGPYADNYVLGDECGWHTWNDGASRVRTWESLDGARYKIAHALSAADPGGVWSGRKLGGIGFWSLMWMAETSSIDPRTGASATKTRTYPHLYQLAQELLARPGERRFSLESFEGLDPRWRDPNEAFDTFGDSDGDSARVVSTAPAGGPAHSVNAMRFTFDFESAGANAAVLAHELLASPLAPGVPDRNALLGHFDRNTRLRVQRHASGTWPNYALRLLVVDGEGELEASPPFVLDSVGWSELVWDLTDDAQVFARATNEPALLDGDGVLDVSSPGARELGFYGFAVEGVGVVSGAVVLDELEYERWTPLGASYVINELRYADSTREFVEIYGPAGALPPGLVLRAYNGANGAVLAQYPLNGAIANQGGGRGYFVIGDPGTLNASTTAGFSLGADNLPNGSPSALQLYSTVTGCVYDSIVYEAWGGLSNLIRASTLDVAREGGAWCGEVATGSDMSGAAHTLGRYPDGADSDVNARDFSLASASPGARNGGLVGVGSRFEFETPQPGVFQTFQSPSRIDPTSAGLPTSPRGGRAWRCVDGSGGGLIGAVGDAALGDKFGYRVRGVLFLPSAAAPAQANAVGLCVRQGSTFFGPTPSSSGYETGYWLIYQNQPGVGLAHGRADHPGVLEFVHATHDNQDGERVTLLGSLPLASTSATPGAWANFDLSIDPSAAPASQLVARLGGAVIYSGPIPSGGPTSGAFGVGFRENHAGPPIASEGTWVDGLLFELATTPLTDTYQ